LLFFFLRYIEWEERYGTVFKIFFGNQKTTLVVCDKDRIREIGLKKFSVFTNRPGPPAKIEKMLEGRTSLGSKFGILSAKDTYWKGVRSISHGIFHSVEQLQSFLPLMKETSAELAERLSSVPEGEALDIWRAFGDMTLDVVGSTVFGVRFNSIQKQGADSVKAARILFANAGPFGANNPFLMFALLLPEWMTPLLKFLAQRFPTKSMREMEWANKVLADVSGEMYELAQNERGENAPAADAPAGNKIPGELEYTGNSFLKLFIEGHNRETGAKLTKEEVVAQAFTFLLAGYETTANTLGYTIYMLTQNKKAEEKLIEEIDRLGQGKTELPTVGELKEYEYLDSVLQEVLRISGPAPLLVRRCLKDADMKEWPMDRIYQGTGIHIATHTLHMNPKYFPEPEKFQPERFVKSSPIYGAQNHKAHMPFGVGPRMCVAADFALTEAKLALITLYRKFQFSHNPDHEFKTTMAVTVGPVNGIEVFVHKRDNTKA